MKKNYHIIGIVCGLLLLLVLAFIFKMETDKAKISEFLDYKHKYDNQTKKMNQLIQKYNKNSTLSVERVNIIQEYLNTYNKSVRNIRKLKTFSKKYPDILQSAGINNSEFAEKLDKQKSAMDKNIQGFQKDLETLNRSVLISYTKKQRVEYERLVARIQDY